MYNNLPSALRFEADQLHILLQYINNEISDNNAVTQLVLCTEEIQAITSRDSRFVLPGRIKVWHRSGHQSRHPLQSDPK